MIGETILERYEVIEAIGQGGMATVYRAVDRVLGRQVAVKVLHPHLAKSSEARKRFHREAHIVARLRHPNIVEVYDYSGEDSETAFIVQEFVAGENFSAFLERHGHLPPEVAAMVISLLAKALEHAHLQGVIHRDIKPENIMIRKDGVLKLMDFGIAHAIDMEHLTITGMILGSPAHMSPEQVEGKALDARTDIFSLGTLFFQAATGRLPFVSETPAGLLKAVSEAKVPDIRTIRPGFPDDLWAIVAKMMAKDPGQRFQTAAEVAAALESITRSLGLEPAEVEVPRFFQDPKGREESICRHVIANRLKRAKAYIATKKYADAARELDTILQHDPTNEEATQAMSRVRALMRRARARRKIGGVLLALILVAGVVTVLGILISELKKPQEVTRSVEPPPSLPVRPLEVAVIAERRQLQAIKAVQVTSSAKKPEKPQKQQNSSPPQPETVPVVIFANPPAVRIIVDGNYVGTGTTGEIHLAPGKHVVTLSHPKCDVCRDASYEIKLDPNKPPRAPLRFSIGYLDALLTVQGPEGAKVFVNGLERGTVGKQIRIPMSQPGPLDVIVSLEVDGSKTGGKKVTLAPGVATSVSLP